MSDTYILPAEQRDRVGKGASRALRRNGRIPAVIYGDKTGPVSIHVEEKELTRQLSTGQFTNSIVMVKVGDQNIRTLPKDVAFHPVTDRPLHVDFLRLAKNAKVEVLVPVVFINEEDSPGLKRGGVLNVVRHELELICEADKIPGHITVDVTGLEVGDAVHFSHVNVPEGVESVITDRDFTIATIVAPSALKKAEGDTTVEGEETEETPEEA